MPSMRPKFFPLTLFVILLASCQAPPQGSGLRTQDGSWIRTDLYFGLSRRDASPISDADFQRFIDATVTPAFPDGFTMIPATGQYLDSAKVLHKEPSRILTILYRYSGAPAANHKIQPITTIYCQKFDQESVLRTDTPAQAHFLSAR